MAWTAPRTWVVGEVFTAALANTHIRDNMLETAAAKVTTAGDIVQATAANALARLGMSGHGGKFLRANAGATALEYAAMSDAVPGPLWGTSFGTIYRARLGAQESIYGAGTPGLLFDGNSGWTTNGTLIRITVSPTTVATGDMNSASDKAGMRLALTPGAGAYFASPRVVGGWEQIQAATKILGQAPTTITIGMVVNADATTADAGDGFGITNDEDAALGTAGVLAILNGATNFEFRNGSAAAISTGIAKDTNAHLVEYVITIGAMTMDVKIDGAVVVNDQALNQDEWPKALFNRTITAVRWEHSFWWVIYE